MFAVYSLWFLARIKREILRKNVTLILIYLVLLKITSMKIGSFELPISDRLKLCSNKTFFSLEIIVKYNEISSNELRFNSTMLAI